MGGNLYFVKTNFSCQFQTSVIFDIKLKGEFDGSTTIHQFVLPPRSIQPYQIPVAGSTIILYNKRSNLLSGLSKCNSWHTRVLQPTNTSIIHSEGGEGEGRKKIARNWWEILVPNSCFWQKSKRCYLSCTLAIMLWSVKAKIFQILFILLYRLFVCPVLSPLTTAIKAGVYSKALNASLA